MILPTRSTCPATLPARAHVPAASTRAARRAVHALLSSLRGGTVVLVDGSGAHRFGTPAADRLQATVIVHDERAYVAVLLHGGTGLGDAYEQGWFAVDDPGVFFQILARSTEKLDAARERLHRATKPVLEPWRRARRPDPARDRDNVRAHYDLGNDFFALFLDESMTYSCAIFDNDTVDLASAQRAKIDRLCRKLVLGPGDHVLEIGSGWGSFALHAATRYGCRVTTTTVSERQYEWVRTRIRDAGLADRITVRHDDYRSLDGTFDKLVSIEMIEAVDWRDHDSYVAACSRLLVPDGVAGIQAIVIDDRRYDRARTSRDFIKDRIFPGGCLPSIESIARSLRRASDLRIVDLEDLGAHYVSTLRRWRQRLRQHWDRLGDAGASDELGRRFELYFAYCEAGFAERRVSVAQFVLARSGWRPRGFESRRG